MKNIYMRTVSVATFAISALLIFPTVSHAQLSIDAYLSAPDATVAPTSYTGTTVETFNSLAVGGITNNYTSTIGTYLTPAGSAMRISADNDFGNGTGNYVAMGEGTSTKPSVTLQLSTPARYFGFAYCAGDKNNGVSFYSGSTLIGRFSTATLLSVLSTTEVTAVNGTKYQSSQYFGKPNTTNTNTTEPSSFVNFFAQGSTTFDRIVFDNTFNDNVFTGFESDNHTVSSTAQAAQGTFVRLGTIVVPEANTAYLLGLALPLIGLVAARKRVAVA